MRGSGLKATEDVQGILEEIGGRLTQAAQSVEAMGQTVAALAEGLAGADAERLVQAATTRLVGLALNMVVAPDGLSSLASAGKRASQDDRGVFDVRSGASQEAGLVAIEGRILEDLPMAVVEVGTASSPRGEQLVAVGIEANGVKRVLGIQSGSGGDREAVERLVADLYRRGLHAAQGSMLLITEGTEAEDATFLARWPRTRVGHCQKAVTEKVLAHLSAESQGAVREALQEAFGVTEVSRAMARLEALEQRLRSHWPGAAASLSRHASASLTVKRLCAGSKLERSVSTLAVLRTAMEQARLWGRDAQGANASDPLPLGATLWEERTRRVIGYEEMPQLVAALAQAGLERTA